MKKIFSQILSPAFFLALLLLPAAPACNKWFDVQPANEQTYASYWQTKEEVHAVMIGAYSGLCSALEKMVMWGEIRSDEMILGPAKSSNEELNSIKELEIKPTFGLVGYLPMYQVIGRCNALLHFAPGVQLFDKTFTDEALKAYLAEATWLRSLCYFYLVRTFRDVPYVTEPYLDDEYKFQIAKTDGDEILNKLVADLQRTLNDLPIKHENNSWQNKGRGTLFASQALLADIFLWQGKYPEALAACNSILNSGVYRLLDTEEWYDLFYPGNSEESIFELQWSDEYEQTNELFNWFHNGGNNASYIISEGARLRYGDPENSTDIRGLKGTFLDNNKIWKYAGTAIGGNSLRSDEQHDANWIIYRLADILLMKAEALVMTDAYLEAYDLVATIRTRAGCTEALPYPGDQGAALDMILDERGRELCFEGKRWYDLVRVAIRDNGLYKQKLIQMLLTNVAPSLRPLYESRLQNPYGYYFPLSDAEVEAGGGELIQNPYYL